MANGEYRSPHFDESVTSKTTSITAQTEVHDEKHFAVRYSPVTPPVEMLNELAESVFMTMRNDLGVRLGRYCDYAKSWLFPIGCYKAGIAILQKLRFKVPYQWNLSSSGRLKLTDP